MLKKFLIGYAVATYAVAATFAAYQIIQNGPPRTVDAIAFDTVLVLTAPVSVPVALGLAVVVSKITFTQ